MRQYIVRRLLQLIPTLFLVSLIIFFVMRVLPGDVAMLVVTGGSGAPEAGAARIQDRDLQDIRDQLGLNDPLWKQYLSWMGGMVTMDWGESLVAGRPVLRDVLRRLPVTLELAVLTSMVAVAAGVPLGVVFCPASGQLDRLRGPIGGPGRAFCTQLLAGNAVSPGRGLPLRLDTQRGARALPGGPPGKPGAGYLACPGAGVLGGGHHQPHDPVCAA